MQLCWIEEVFYAVLAAVQFSVGDSHGKFVVEEELEVVQFNVWF
jgi:hypothetical protein